MAKGKSGAGSRKRQSKEIETPKITKVNKTELEKQVDTLINDLQSNLLTVRQLTKGGSHVRGRYEKEKCYLAQVDEINALRAQLKLRPVGLGQIRREK